MISLSFLKLEGKFPTPITCSLGTLWIEDTLALKHSLFLPVSSYDIQKELLYSEEITKQELWQECMDSMENVWENMATRILGDIIPKCLIIFPLLRLLMILSSAFILVFHHPLQHWTRFESSTVFKKFRRKDLSWTCSGQNPQNTLILLLIFREDQVSRLARLLWKNFSLWITWAIWFELINFALTVTKLLSITLWWQYGAHQTSCIDATT